MLDTIWCSFVINIPWRQLKGWRKATFFNQYENYYYNTYNGISFRYYYNFYKNKIPCPRLWMDFSAATMQNGINILGYNFGKSHIAIKEIEKTVSKVVGRPISLKKLTVSVGLTLTVIFVVKAKLRSSNFSTSSKKSKVVLV